MRRFIRVPLALAIVSVVVFGPAGISRAQGEITEKAMGNEDDREPVVALSDGSAEADDADGTPCSQVHTLPVAAATAFLGVSAWYELGVNGRFRVAT